MSPAAAPFAPAARRAVRGRAGERRRGVPEPPPESSGGRRVLCQLPAAPAPRRLWVLRAGPGAARGGPRCRRQGGERAASLLGCGGRGGSLRAFLRGPGRRVPVPSLPGTLRLAAVPLGRQGVRSETFESRVAPGLQEGKLPGEGHSRSRRPLLWSLHLQQVPFSAP